MFSVVSSIQSFLKVWCIAYTGNPQIISSFKWIIISICDVYLHVVCCIRSRLSTGEGVVFPLIDLTSTRVGASSKMVLDFQWFMSFSFLCIQKLEVYYSRLFMSCFNILNCDNIKCCLKVFSSTNYITCTCTIKK